MGKPVESRTVCYSTNNNDDDNLLMFVLPGRPSGAVILIGFWKILMENTIFIGKSPPALLVHIIS